VSATASSAAYVFVDTAFGSVAHRNRVRRLSEIDFEDHGRERYITHRRADEALLEWTRSHLNVNGNPTVEGFDGAVWDPSLPFDFDDKHDPAHALGWLREFLVRQERNDVPLDALRIYFSGAKGFHVEIPHTLFGGFEPATNLHVWEKAAALELMGGIPFDQSIYDKLRLWRLANTLNAKGNRYKVRLSLDEALGLSMQEIDALAVQPRARLVTAPDEEWATNAYLADVWQRAQLPPLTSEPQQRAWSDQRLDRVVVSAIIAAIAESWPATDPGISRHTDYLLPLSGFLSRHMTADVVAELLKEAARRSGDHNFLDDRQRHWEDEITRLAQGSADKLAADSPTQGLQTLSRRWPELAEFLGNVLITATTLQRATGASRNGRAMKLTLTLLEDLLAEPPEEVAYTVEGLLPSSGVSLWGAKPKVGKSVAVRNLAMNVAHGEPFLGRAVQQGAVIVLALEEKRAEVANHFRNMGGTNELIHVHTGAAPETSKEGLAELQELITRHHPVLVVVDPLLKLVRVKDSSDYAELTRQLEPVVEMARINNCHIAVVHHLGKMTREGGDDVLGSTAIFAAVDTLVLFRRRKDNVRVLQTIQRYGADLPEMLLPMDQETGRIVLGVELAEVRGMEAQQAVRDLLGKLGDDEWLDQKSVREQAGVQSLAAYKALQALVEKGEVERSGGGKPRDPFRYRLTAFDVQPQPADVSWSVGPVDPLRDQETKTINIVETAEFQGRVVCRWCGRGEETHTADDVVCGRWGPRWEIEL
jgi:hypothetical protein